MDKKATVKSEIRTMITLGLANQIKTNVQVNEECLSFADDYMTSDPITHDISSIVERVLYYTVCHLMDTDEGLELLEKLRLIQEIRRIEERTTVQIDSIINSLLGQ